jgi:hypothetical protein
VLIAVILAFDVLIVGLAFSLGGGSPFKEKIAPNTNPVQLVQSQLRWNTHIPETGYDSALTKENYGASFTIVDPDKLKPLYDPIDPSDESKWLNNYFRDGVSEAIVTNPDGTTTTETKKVKLLYDEVTVGRIIKLNCDWIDYANDGVDTVFESTRSGSKAEAYYKDLAEGGKVNINQLAFGTIYRDGNTVYALVHMRYTVTKPAANTVYDVVFLYKLVRSGGTLVVSDFEVVKLPSSTPTNVTTPPAEVQPAQSQPVYDDTAGQQPEEDISDSGEYQPEDGSGEGTEGQEGSQGEADEQ